MTYEMYIFLTASGGFSEIRRVILKNIFLAVVK